MYNIDKEKDKKNDKKGNKLLKVVKNMFKK